MAVRFATAKSGPERATKTRQYDLLRARLGQKEPPRPGSTICYGQERARKSHQDPAICYGQEWARKSHQDPAVRFALAEGFLICLIEKDPVITVIWISHGTTPQTATHLSAIRLPHSRCCNARLKEPPRPGSTICYGQEWARKEPPRPGSTICYGQEWVRKSHPERGTKTRQYDLLRPRVGQKEPPRPGSTAVRFVTAEIGSERAIKTRRYDLLRPRVGQKEPPRPGSMICYGYEWARKSHQDPAVRFTTAKSGPERATKTRQYDLLRPKVGQKEPPRPSSTICYGQEWARKSHQDPAVRFVAAKSGPERAPRPGSTISYGQERAGKSHQDPAVRFVTAKTGPERATKTRQCGSTICNGRDSVRKSHQDPAVRFVTAKGGPERATKTRQYDLLRLRVGQKKPPRLGSTIRYGQEWARKSHHSALRFDTAKSGPGRATKTRQYDLLRARVG